MTRADYGSGSPYQRTLDWRWVGALDHGTNANGKRRRVTVSIKGCEGGCPERCKHRAEIKRKLRDKKRALDRGDDPTSSRATVRTWATEWLRQKQRTLRPKAYRAAASPVQKWIVPTIGHRRLSDLTANDIRKVADAQRDAGRKTATAAATHRTLLNMLRDATREGHPIPPPCLTVRAPTADQSDRRGMTIPEGLACLKVAATLDHGTRWLVTLLYGMRQGECLGLTWDAIDFNAGPFGEMRIEWQLQALPYIDPADKKRGFRVPDGLARKHLVDAWHLVPPKSNKGFRVAPLLEPVRDALLKWREIAPENPWGLVWPTAGGRPANVKSDEREWYALQATAGVSHPDSPRAYYVHETRNFAATMLLDAEVPEHVVTDLLGHSSVATSLRYRTVRREPLLEALTRVGQRLELG